MPPLIGSDALKGARSHLAAAHRLIDAAESLPDDQVQTATLVAIGHALTGLLELQLGEWPVPEEEGS